MFGIWEEVNKDQSLPFYFLDQPTPTPIPSLLPTVCLAHDLEHWFSGIQHYHQTALSFHWPPEQSGTPEPLVGPTGELLSAS